jgi:hypothetical protein
VNQANEEFNAAQFLLLKIVMVRAGDAIRERVTGVLL